MTTADDFFGSAVPSASFDADNPPVTVSGTVVGEPEVVQQREYLEPKRPLYWGSNSRPTTDAVDPQSGQPNRPVNQLKVKLQTELRDPSIDSDDGIRAVYLASEKQKAVGDALRKAGARAVKEGGWLSLTWYGNGQQTPEQIRARMSPKKLFQAEYRPPADTSQDAVWGGAAAAPADPWAVGAAAVQQAPQAPAQPVYQQPAAPQYAQPPQQPVQQQYAPPAQPVGLDPAILAAMPDSSIELLKQAGQLPADWRRP